MTGRPETQTSTANASFTKKPGLPTALHSRSLAYRYTHHFRLPTSQAIHTGADSVLSRAHALSLPSLLSSLSGPCPNIGILNPSQIKKKINEKMWSFCFVLSCLSSGYICSQKPWTGAFWSTSQMTRLLMGPGQCHI